MTNPANLNTGKAAQICSSARNGDILKDVVDITKQPQDAAQAADSALAPENSYETENPECSQDGPRAAPNPFNSAHRNKKENVIMNADGGSRKGPDGAPVSNKALGVAMEALPRKTIKVDVAKYQAWLDDPALSEEQKEQILEALWQIILCFVDLGFRVSPLDNACGQVAESEGFCGAHEQDMVVSKAHTLSETFNNIAAE